MRSQTVIKHVAEIEKCDSCFYVSSFLESNLSPVIKSVEAYLPPQRLDFPDIQHSPVLKNLPWDEKLQHWSEMHIAFDPIRPKMLIAQFHPLLVGFIVEFNIEVEVDMIKRYLAGSHMPVYSL